jgi:hypothetical protein
MTTAGELWQKSLSSLEAGKRLSILYFRQRISRNHASTCVNSKITGQYALTQAIVNCSNGAGETHVVLFFSPVLSFS